MTTEPEALRVASDLEQSRGASYERERVAARLLRKQHAEIERFGWSGECRHVAGAIRARGET